MAGRRRRWQFQLQPGQTISQNPLYHSRHRRPSFLLQSSWGYCKSIRVSSTWLLHTTARASRSLRFQNCIACLRRWRDSRIDTEECPSSNERHIPYCLVGFEAGPECSNCMGSHGSVCKYISFVMALHVDWNTQANSESKFDQRSDAQPYWERPNCWTMGSSSPIG